METNTNSASIYSALSTNVRELCEALELINLYPEGELTTNDIYNDLCGLSDYIVQNLNSLGVNHENGLSRLKDLNDLPDQQKPEYLCWNLMILMGEIAFNPLLTESDRESLNGYIYASAVIAMVSAKKPTNQVSEV